MRLILSVLMMLVFVMGCSSNEAKHSKTPDTAAVYPTDSNIPVDTDDYNAPGPSTVPLDAPVDSTPPPKHTAQ